MKDVIVIGAGVTGSFIAKELSKFNLKVLVIERKLAPGLEQTKSCSGIIHPFQLPFKLLRSKLCLEGNRMMDAEAEELGFEFKRVGLITVATNLLTFLAIPFIIQYLRKHGVKAERIGKKKLLEMEPNLNENVYGGILIPSAGVVNPVEMTAKACLFAKLNGVEFLYGCNVNGIQKKDEYFVVKTNKGDFESKVVINCAGIYADEIAKMIGYEMKIIPGKGTHIVFAEKGFTNHLVVAIPLKPNKRTKGGGALIGFDGKPIWGPNLIDVESKEDTSVKKEEIEGIIAKFSPLFKRTPNEIIAVYAGLRSIAGSDFVINEPVKCFINVAGIQSPGLTAAPAIAKMVLEMISKHFELKKKDKISRLPKKKSEEEICKSLEEDEIVCLCNMVTKKDILKIAEEFKCFDGVKQITWAGMDCERCKAEIIRLVGEKVLKDSEGGEIAWF
ncbi:MAG: NAD(P)/FAD-dependent oxidoreductase [Archaeoglobaceae archaeon]|nr:NAD(P)/FAD-dependent oxidoreductase [Archaeoglobaceae archaeon]MDW8118415.1 NAD(P)/FAD-dependent oxidoreductase [Archaeoglobaceae archaeon]